MTGLFDFEQRAREFFDHAWEIINYDVCQSSNIREVDWRETATREHEYGIVTYWTVSPNGARGFMDRQEEMHERPDYTYLCKACDRQFWFWSDVLLHVSDRQELVMDQTPDDKFPLAREIRYRLMWIMADIERVRHMSANIPWLDEELLSDFELEARLKLSVVDKQLEKQTKENDLSCATATEPDPTTSASRTSI